MARKFKSLADYRREAKREPFELPIDDKTTIVLPQPSGDDLLEVEEAGTSRKALQILAGDKYDELIKVLGAEDAGVMKAVITDMRDHFGLGE